MSLQYLAAILAISLCVTGSAQPAKCYLQGNIVNRESRNIYLVKARGDLRAYKQIIPIKGNRFGFSMNVSDMTAWKLVFEDEFEKGVYVPIFFFPDGDTIRFTLHSKNKNDSNILYGGEVVDGGLLNKAYYSYQKESFAAFNPRFNFFNEKINALRKANDYETPVYDSLRKLWYKIKDEEAGAGLRARLNQMEKEKNHLTENGRNLLIAFEDMLAARSRWIHDYIRTHPSIASYFLLETEAYTQAKNNNEILESVRKLYADYSFVYPSHPYTASISAVLSGLDLLTPGQPFVDFTAPDMTGTPRRFSDLQKGKITLLDLWGSWCGPCIAVSRTMMPVYREFGKKGFQVIGVAREFENTKALKQTLAREKYPWLNLLELDDKNKIWTRYGVPNQGGAVFLFDKDGKTLAVNPDADEVRKILGEKL